jgi:hypothetical protein
MRLTAMRLALRRPGPTTEEVMAVFNSPSPSEERTYFELRLDSNYRSPEHHTDTKPLFDCPVLNDMTNAPKVRGKNL